MIHPKQIARLCIDLLSSVNVSKDQAQPWSETPVIVCDLRIVGLWFGLAYIHDFQRQDLHVSDPLI